MPVQNLHDLFLEALKDIYYVESTLLQKLPEMSQSADSSELKDAINVHLRETEVQLERLEEAFRILGTPPMAKVCEALDGLLKEADTTVGAISDAETRDAAIIAAAQTVEHYEIARYGTLASWAAQMGSEELCSLLESTLSEEKNADETLSALAEGAINQRAAA